MKRMYLAGLSVIIISVALFVGCSQNPVQELRLSNIVFSSEEPAAYMDYKEQPAATYKLGDTVWIYMNLKGQKYNSNSDGTTEMWFAETITVKTSAGEVLLSQEVLNEHKNFSKELDPNKVFLVNHITTTQQMTEGRYTAEMVVSDKLADKTVKESSSFTLER